MARTTVSVCKTNGSQPPIAVRATEKSSHHRFIAMCNMIGNHKFCHRASSHANTTPPVPTSRNIPAISFQFCPCSTWPQPKSRADGQTTIQNGHPVPRCNWRTPNPRYSISSTIGENRVRNTIGSNGSLGENRLVIAKPISMGVEQKSANQMAGMRGLASPSSPATLTAPFRRSSQTVPTQSNAPVNLSMLSAQ